MNRVIVVLCVSLFTFGYRAVAQSALGLSINYGDQITYKPTLAGFFKDRRSLSPTLCYSIQEQLGTSTSLLFGIQAGVAGYQFIPIRRDTLGPNGITSPFVEYGIFVSHVDAQVGKDFSLRRRSLFLGFGGGVSYYYVFFPYTTMDVVATYQGTAVSVFSAQAEAPESGTAAGFIKGTAKLDINPRWSIVVSYSQHFQRVLYGDFEFNHSKVPVSGSFKLVPSGFSLAFMCQISRYKKAY